MSVYRDIYEKIVSSQDGQDMLLSGEAARLLKLQEEAGEVAEAVICYYGLNARKRFKEVGEATVAKELADVVVTAMVAMHDWTDNPEQFMKEHLQGLLERIKREGS